MISTNAAAHAWALRFVSGDSEYSKMITGTDATDTDGSVSTTWPKIEHAKRSGAVSPAARATASVVPVTMPVKNTSDLVALAKRRPGELTYGTSGPGSMSHFAGEMFKRLAGVNMITVPYKGNEIGRAHV